MLLKEIDFFLLWTHYKTQKLVLEIGKGSGYFLFIYYLVPFGVV